MKFKKHSNQWSIGIDFGTTNSCVYFKENKENPKELILKIELIYLMNRVQMKKKLKK